MRNSAEIIQLIKKLREDQELSVEELANRVGIAKSTLSRYENGHRDFPINDIERYAFALNTNVEHLLGIDKSSSNETFNTVPGSKETPIFSPKEKKDIAVDLERMLSDLESNEALAFQGEPMDDETKELMRISLENSLRLAKQLAKQKFTPNKYKK